MQLINYKDPRPIFEQIVENFKMQILMGVMIPGEQMPSVRALAVELSTNPNTVQKAYIILEQQGYIYSVKGKGNFVSNVSHLLDSKKDELVHKMKKLVEETEALGFNAGEIYALATGGKRAEPPLRDWSKTDTEAGKQAAVLRGRFSRHPQAEEESDADLIEA